MIGTSDQMNDSVESIVVQDSNSSHADASYPNTTKSAAATGSSNTPNSAKVKNGDKMANSLKNKHSTSKKKSSSSSMKLLGSSPNSSSKAHKSPAVSSSSSGNLLHFFHKIPRSITISSSPIKVLESTKNGTVTINSDGVTEHTPQANTNQQETKSIDVMDLDDDVVMMPSGQNAQSQSNCLHFERKSAKPSLSSNNIPLVSLLSSPLKRDSLMSESDVSCLGTPSHLRHSSRLDTLEIGLSSPDISSVKVLDSKFTDSLQSPSTTPKVVHSTSLLSIDGSSSSKTQMSHSSALGVITPLGKSTTTKPRKGKRASNANVSENGRASVKKSKKSNNVFQLHINQDPLDLSKHPITIQALSEFFGTPSKIALLQSTNIPTSPIDQLICLYGHESRASLKELVSTLIETLYPFVSSPEQQQEKDQARSLLMNRIPSILERVNYGFDINAVKPYLPAHIASENHDNEDARWDTAPWCVWVWETRHISLLPEDLANTTLATRQHQRSALRQEWRDGFSKMEDEKKRMLFASIYPAPQTNTEQIMSPTHSKPDILNSPIPNNTSHQSAIMSPNATLASPIVDPGNLFANELKKQKELEKLRQKEQAEELKRQKQRERDLAKEEKQRAKEEKEKEKLAKKLQKEEAERLAREAKQKQQKAQAALMGMFVVSGAHARTSSSSSAIESAVKKQETDYQKVFRPFHIKEHMKLSPLVTVMPKVNFDSALPALLDDFVTIQTEFRDFCKVNRKHLRGIPLIPRNYRFRRASLTSSSADDMAQKSSYSNPIVIVDDDDGKTVGEFGKSSWKLLQFGENVRPAYFGTWVNKSSKLICGRRPFAQDTSQFDYEYDSEAEWEEDEPGEELKSDDEDEDDDGPGPREEEEEDGWLVPHGYLSDDEGIEEEGEDNSSDILKLSSKVNNKNATTDAQPGKRKPLEPLVPVVLGPYYYDEESDKPGGKLETMRQDSGAMQILADLKVGPIRIPGLEITVGAIFSVDPFKVPVTLADETRSENPHADNSTPGTPNASTSLSSAGTSKSTFPEHLINELIEYLEGRDEKLSTLVDMFQKKHPALKKIAIEMQIRLVAERTRCPSTKKFKWVVKNKQSLAITT